MQFSKRVAEIISDASSIVCTDFIADIGPLGEVGIDTMMQT